MLSFFLTLFMQIHEFNNLFSRLNFVILYFFLVLLLEASIVKFSDLLYVQVLSNWSFYYRYHFLVYTHIKAAFDRKYRIFVFAWKYKCMDDRIEIQKKKKNLSFNYHKKSRQRNLTLFKLFCRFLVIA